MISTNQEPASNSDSPSHVWYASYGSNMNAERFSHYIQGGALTGTSRVYKGADDKTPPLADALLSLPHQMYFAGESSVWTGGVAYLGHSKSEDATLSKAYLITPNQFEQVVAEEGRRDDVPHLDIPLLLSLGRLTLGSRAYDEMLYVGEKDGFPVITFTSPREDRPYNKPAPAYLKMIALGLQDAHGLNNLEVEKYLLSKPGIKGSYTAEELGEAIA